MQVSKLEPELYNKLYVYAESLLGTKESVRVEDLVHDYILSSYFRKVKPEDYSSSLGYIYRGMKMLAYRPTREDRMLNGALATEGSELDNMEDSFHGFQEVDITLAVSKYYHLFTPTTRKLIHFYLTDPNYRGLQQFCKESNIQYESAKEMARRIVRPLLHRLVSDEFNTEVIEGIKKHKLTPIKSYPGYFINRQGDVYCIFKRAILSFNKCTVSPISKTRNRVWMRGFDYVGYVEVSDLLKETYG